MNNRCLLVVALVLASSATSSFAHHGTSITYEMDKTVTVTGTVDEFDFGYPHPALFVDVNAAGVGRNSTPHFTTCPLPSLTSTKRAGCG